MRRVSSNSPRQTRRLAASIAQRLSPGSVVGLAGPLGAGKTQFTRGLVEALPGAHQAEISSPTYALLNVYPTTPPVYHFDFYRLTDLDDLESTGFWDVVTAGDGIVVIEWFDRIPEALDEKAIRVWITITGEKTRQIQVDGDEESASP